MNTGQERAINQKGTSVFCRNYEDYGACLPSLRPSLPPSLLSFFPFRYVNQKGSQEASKSNHRYRVGAAGAPYLAGGVLVTAGHCQIEVVQAWFRHGWGWDVWGSRLPPCLLLSCSSLLRATPKGRRAAGPTRCCPDLLALLSSLEKPVHYRAALDVSGGPGAVAK